MTDSMLPLFSEECNISDTEYCKTGKKPVKKSETDLKSCEVAALKPGYHSAFLDRTGVTSLCGLKVRGDEITMP